MNYTKYEKENILRFLFRQLKNEGLESSVWKESGFFIFVYEDI